MSKRKKLKRALKTAALLGAAGLGAAALGRKRRQGNEMKEFLKTEGGNLSILPKAKRFVNVGGKMAFPVDVDALPREIAGKIKNTYGFDTNAKNFGFPMPQETGAMMLTGVGDYMPMKKGGRARKTKFSKNKKQQANRSKKK
jgi:hypothetical protein